jgi:hypothetical protein
MPGFLNPLSFLFPNLADCTIDIGGALLSDKTNYSRFR